MKSLVYCLKMSVSCCCVVGALLVIGGCAQRVHLPKPSVAAQPVYCFDTVGHTPHAKPFALGGTCCCTPTEAVLADWHANGYFSDQTLEGVIAVYHQRGIMLATDHKHCNNVCDHGPHVVKDGKCMVPPTPGTENYEEVIFGCMYVPKNRAPQHYRQRVPSTNVAYHVDPVVTTQDE